MSKFIQNAVSKRVIAVYKELFAKDMVKGPADFCRHMEYQHQSWSQVEKGVRNVPVEVLSKLFTVFDVSPEYIFTGKGAKFSKSDGIVNEPEILYTVAEKNQVIETLKELIETQKQAIAEYKDKLIEKDKRIAATEKVIVLLEDKITSLENQLNKREY